MPSLRPPTHMLSLRPPPHMPSLRPRNYSLGAYYARRCSAPAPCNCYTTHLASAYSHTSIASSCTTVYVCAGRFRFKSFNRSDAPPASGPPPFMEQIDSVLLGARALASELDGAADEDTDEYFFVQGPASRSAHPSHSSARIGALQGARAPVAAASASAMRSRPVCPALRAPDGLDPHAGGGGGGGGGGLRGVTLCGGAGGESAGVYGGLPSSFGSSEGTPPPMHEHRLHAHAQGREPAGVCADTDI
jgi:hypothetical protein